MLSKLDGLKRIESLGLPHPDWRFVSHPGEVPREPWSDASVGWTIRCAPGDRYEFWMPSIHHVDFADVRSAMTALEDACRTDAFVVYPSWEPIYSGSCYYTRDGGGVELVNGEIGPLLNGRVLPDIIVDLEPPLFIRRTVKRGDTSGLPKELIGRLGSSMRTAANFASSATMEWVWADRGGLMFYDWHQTI